MDILAARGRALARTGQDMTARDVVFTVSLEEMGRDDLQRNARLCGSWTAVDDYTLAVTMKYPFYGVINALDFPVVPGCSCARIPRRSLPSEQALSDDFKRRGGRHGAQSQRSVVAQAIEDHGRCPSRQINAGRAGAPTARRAAGGQPDRGLLRLGRRERIR